MADPAADIIIPRFMELQQKTVDGLFSPQDENYRKRKDAIFKSCDKEGDGVLNEAEYIELQKANLDLWREMYGEAPNITEDELKKVYAIKDKFQPETDGITLEDFRLLSEALMRHPQLKLTRRGDVKVELEMPVEVVEPAAEKKEDDIPEDLQKIKEGAEKRIEETKEKLFQDDADSAAKQSQEAEKSTENVAKEDQKAEAEAGTEENKDKAVEHPKPIAEEESTPMDSIKEFFGFKKDGEETENPIE